MRVVRRLLHAVILALTLVVGAAAAAIIVSQTVWFKNLLRGYIVSQANQYLNGQLTIERLGGNLFFGVELENVGITMDGAEVVSVQDLAVDYSVFDLVSHGMIIDDIRLNKPVLYLRREGEAWSIARLIKRQRTEVDREGPAAPLAIAAIGISDGSIVLDDPVGTSGVDVPNRLDRLDAQLSFNYEPVHYSIEVAHLSFRGSEPMIGVNELSGGLALRDDTLYLERLALRTEETSLAVDGAVQHYLTTPKLNLRMSSDKFSLSEIARVVPMLAGVTLQPQFEVQVDGPLDGMAVDLNVRSSAGQLTGRFVADLMTPDQSLTGDFAVRHLDLAPLVQDPQQRTDLTADSRIDLRARTFGDLESLRGRVSLTAPRVAAMGYVAERVTANASVRGTQITLDAGAAAYGGTATASGAVSLPLNGASLAFDLKGYARGLDLRRLPASLKVTPVETAINLEYHGRGTGPRQLEVDLRFEESHVAGAAVVTGSTASVSMQGDDLAFRTDAAVADLDLQQIGREFHVPALESERYQGRFGGRVVTEGNVTGLPGGVTLDNVQATIRLDLDPTRIAGLAIDRVTLDADYRDRLAAIRQFDVVGRDLNVKASGTLALNETGQSNLVFEADTSRLEEIGTIANLDLRGIAKIDGTLTGNLSELRATGHLVGNGINYGETGALSLTTDYDARVPDLTIDRVGVSADTKAAFVTVAGQHIDDLTAKTTYADRQVQFDATAKQPERSLTVAGSAAFHTDHQEIHLGRLTLETQGLAWQLAPGSEATIQYGNSTVAMKDLRLVSDDQQMTADGTFGVPDSTLQFTFENVDLASVDAILLRPPQFAGRLDASGTVTGSTDAPHVEGKFLVRDGAFREFKYQNFGGTLLYAGPTLAVDTRLQQNPTQWITAKGTVPVALFSRPSEDASAPGPGESMDLTFESSPIALGLIQGFTTALTGVTGTLEAHVRITGTADDPRPEGAITVKDGALTVAPTGVDYKNIAGRIELQPDRVHIDQITVLDNHDSALSVTGDLAIRERQLGGVQLYLTANDFKVIDNKMGNVRIESNLEVNGELRAPRLGGYFGVSTGRVKLDEIIALAGPSAYSTEATEFLDSQSRDQPEQTPSVFDALTMDVALYVPNDLIIQASSLQTPGAPIGLGALNVTLGGDLRAVKDPLSRVRLSGAVNTVRGTYDFQGRRFEILRDGNVRFDGVDELNPRLDIRTRRLIQGVEAFVTIRGTLQQPEIVLTSNPPLEEGDILALVVFNRPLSELGEGEQVSLAARAQALAAGAVVNQLAQSIGGALHLDTFEIELAPEVGTDALVTIGQQIGRDLYLKVQQGVGDQSMTNIILEFELKKWLRLQTNVAQGSSAQPSVFRRAQDTGADLIFFFSF